MKLASRASGAVRGVAVALTVVFAALTIVIGQSDEIAPVVIEEGAPAPQTFIATERVSVVDVDATENARTIESAGVPDVFVEDSQTTAAVLDSIQVFFENARSAAEPLIIDPPDPPGTVGPTTTTTTAPAASVLDITADTGEASTFVAALEATGLTDSLAGDGPFTVFAPIDAAFDAALVALGIDEVTLLDDSELLTSILNYHIVAGQTLDTALMETLDGLEIGTVHGQTVPITATGSRYFVGDAEVVAADFIAGNGVVHLIDGVLLPDDVIGGAGSTTTTAGGTGGETTTSSTTTTTTPATTTSTSTTTTTVPPSPPPLQLQIAELRDLHPLLRLGTITVMVDIVNDDYDRGLAGEEEIFRFVEDEALTLANSLLEQGIKPNELEAVRTDLVTNPPTLILLRGLDSGQRERAESGVADLVAVSLQANSIKNEAATEAARTAAAEQVTEVTVAWVPGEAIVRANERVSAIQLQAIEQLGLLAPADSPPPLRALALVVALIAILAILFLWRLNHEFWNESKLVVLFGLLVVVAAVAARVPELVSRDRIELAFLIPASLLGYLAANLFDSRVAVLMAVPVATFAGLASGDLAITIFAAGAALLPIPLVSAVSSRGQLNAAVFLTAVALVPFAGTISWFFHGSDTMILAGLWGGVSGVISGVLALGILPFLSTVFGVTTTQTLLDLTDRNHPALRRLEETAPGTFNHSIMVGNLAGKAARTIGGNPLLAQAMAYYHDFGKTVNPKYFVENQFGVSNPHDQLPPEESARIIRSHVAEGLRLAREFRIPPDVTQGILTHHGTSLMRFFYHKAGDLYGDDVDAIDYRHRGRKPRSKEMVIVMLSDATEAAARAMVQHEDPTSEKLRALVEGIIGEKVEDGQLEESDVTFGELTRIKEAFVDTLIGYYHTRIPYPGFPIGQPPK